jgi:uncharacterized protein (TIGR03382 family)
MVGRRSLSHGLAWLLCAVPSAALAQGLPTADLRVVSLGAPMELFRGIIAPVDVWIANDGTAAASAFTVEVYVGSPAQLVGQFGPFTVPAGMRARPQLDVVVPASVPLGATTLFVILDPTNVVAESRESNNVADTPVNVAEPLCDLVVTLDATRINAELGQTASIPFEVLNVGLVDAPASSLAVHVSVDPRISTSDRRIDVVPIPDLPPGQPYGTNAIVLIPLDLAPGVYWIGAIADSASAALELDENNNIALGPTIELFAPELRITTTELPVGAVGEAYLAQLVASGGTIAPTWTIVAGRLPSGLTLDEATGVIAGVPSEGATITILVEAVSGPASASASLDLEVRPGATMLTILGAPLPPATVGLEYSADLYATGGTPPYSFLADELPDGLSLGRDGQLAGAPTRAGRAVFGVRVFDAAMNAASAELEIEIGAAVAELTITPTRIPTATVDRNYHCRPDVVAELEASGGVAPHVWSIIEGALPDGYSLAAASGRICGTADRAGEYSFVARVEDARGRFDTERFTLSVGAGEAVEITTTRLPAAILTRAYSEQLDAVGGRSPYTWSVEGALPPGLELTSSGELRGTPVTAGVFAFAVRVRDASGAEDVAALSIEARRIDGSSELDTVDGSGCSCSSTPNRGGDVTPVLVLLATLVLGRRRR